MPNGGSPVARHVVGDRSNYASRRPQLLRPRRIPLHMSWERSSTTVALYDQGLVRDSDSVWRRPDVAAARRTTPACARGRVGAARRGDHQPTHFGLRYRDQINAPFGAASFAWARTAARNASANIESVMWRCQPVHERTSYSSSPTSCLAVSKHVSIDQRLPAAMARSAIVASGGAAHR